MIPLYFGLAIVAIFAVAVIVFMPKKSRPTEEPTKTFEPMFEETHRPPQLARPSMNPNRIQEGIEAIKKAATKEEEEIAAKKRAIGRGNMLDMIHGYDRLKGKQEAKKTAVEVPYNNPKNHFRGDIDRIVRLSEQEKKDRIAKNYQNNVEEVLSHVRKANA